MVRDLFINAVILIAFISIRYNTYRDSGINCPDRTSVRLLCGFFSGSLGIVLMLFSVHAGPNIIVDFRNIAIVFAAIHGGIIPAMIAGSFIGLFRMIYYGLSAVSVAALIIAIVDSMGCGLISHYVKALRAKWIYCILWCLLFGSIGFTVLIKDTVLLIQILMYYWLGSVLIAVLLYPYVAFLEDKNEKFRKLQEESTTDFLTGLNNVRAFDSYYNQALYEVKEKTKDFPCS